MNKVNGNQETAIDLMLADTAATHGIELSRDSASRLLGARKGLSAVLERSPHVVCLDDEPSAFEVTILAAAAGHEDAPG
ncbi:MAG: hypothetical protein ACR2RL_26025 [Gammaproteobacteria bacterium]